ncbi:MAG: hypothetical protein GY769_12470 [bacterium]|nr:hypothetical protein [bacterium]
MRSRRRLICLIAAFLTPVQLVAEARREPVELTGGRTEVRFNAHLLEDLGISLERFTASEKADQPGLMEFRILETSVLGLALPSGSYRGPVSGFLSHEGGLEIDWQDDHVSLLGFELHPGLPPNAFELRASDGSLVFVLDNPHPQPNSDGSEFLFLDMDLRFSGQLAERLGRPELEGLAVGEAHVRTRRKARAQVPTHEPLSGAEAGAGLCAPDFNGPVDVLLESMSSVSETFHDSQRVALAPAVRLQNVGTADVPWYRSIAPDGWGSFTVVGQHPFLVMHLYRLADGRIEQIGRSDAKHAFFSGNTPPCDCQADQVLFNDCTDLYGASTNANRKFLAPREEITASTGAWTSTASHFDGPLPDDLRGHDEADHLDPFEHRLSAAIADLQTPGAEYRLEAWYLVQGDIDIFNSMGHRAVVPTVGTPWTFPFADVELTQGSVLDTWVDPLAPPVGAAHVNITTNPDEGELKLAVKASVLPTGLYHYEFALMNFDFDRQIDSFSVPLPAGAIVQNAWFGDVDSDPGNDWSATVSAGSITWQAPAGNELDWGTLFNFSFDTNTQPGAVQVTLGVLEAGSPMVLTPTTVAPATLLPASEIEVALVGSGSGQVASLPGGIACAGDCAEIYADGVGLELSATATSGSAFLRWEEGAAMVSQDLVLGFAVAGDRDLVAVFDSCQADVTLSPQVVSSPAVFHACESITAGNGFEIASDVIFRAGQAIALGDGFTVAAGASFRAEILPEQSTVP